MAEEFDKELCNERHSHIDFRLNVSENTISDLIKTINGKFNKIIFMFLGVLMTIIGSLIVFIITGQK